MYAFAWRGEVFSKKDNRRYSFYVTANSEDYARSQVQSLYGSDAKILWMEKAA